MADKIKLIGLKSRLGQVSTPASRIFIIACLVIGVLLLIALTIRSLFQTEFAGGPLSNLVNELMGTMN